MKILIVDDSNDKIAGIVKVVKENVKKEIVVETVLDSISAQRKLQKSSYDLLIIDMLLPIRAGEEPVKHGGKQLVQEIERKNSLKSPKYIVGTSQFEEYLDLFPNIWNTLYYDSSSTSWKKQLKRIIKHIEKVDFNVHSNSENLPSIFVEGLTDKKILKSAIKLFSPDLLDNIVIKADKNAGALWVSNQVVAWAHSMIGGTNNDIKALGILDGDQAGIEAKDEVDRIIDTNSAKRKLYQLIKLSPDYARDLIPLYSKGLIIPVTLEELYPPHIWSYAKENGWLRERSSDSIILEQPSQWNRRKQSLDEFISTLDLSKEDHLYLNKVERDAKHSLANYICNLERTKKKEALKNFKLLIEEIANFFSVSTK